MLLAFFVFTRLIMSLQSSSYPKGYSNEKDIFHMCFYNQDESKCPSSISKKYYFGPKNYFTNLFSTSHQSFEIFIAESIELDEPLFFSSPVSFFLYGQHISGSIQLGSQTKLYLQDSHNLIITINWSVKTKKISTIYAKSQVQSIYILVSDYEQIDQISSYNLLFYSGEETNCILSSIKSNTKNNYSIFNQKGQYYVQFTSSNHYLNFDNNYNQKAQQNSALGDNVYYTTKRQDMYSVITISGTGPTYNFTKSPFDILILKRCIIEEGVTSIGSNLFKNEIFLEYLEIPSSVTFIGNNSFFRCNLKQLIIPNSVTYIGDYAFYHNSYLEEVEMSNQISYIGIQCFRNCEKLNSITLYEGITDILMNTFYQCYSLKTVNLDNCKNLKSINSAFYECYNLISIQIPETVSNISMNSFYCCYKLPKINLPNKITIINIKTFSYCCSLASITIPESVKVISREAFYGCYNLESITIPKNVEKIGDYAFTKCLKMKEFVVNESNTYFTTIDGALIYKSYSLIHFPPAKVIESYEIPSIIRRLENQCFYYCTNIKHLTIHAEINELPDYAFAHCHRLESLVYLRTSYMIISSNALYFCYNLLYIVNCCIDGTIFNPLRSEYNKMTIYVPKDFDLDGYDEYNIIKTDDILCRTIHYKCNQCNNENKTCTKCDEGWKLNNNKCVLDCSLITDHCIECISIGVCSSCEKGYILDDNQQCIQTNICDNIIDNCAVCHKSSEEFVCDHCFDGFILSSDGLKCVRDVHLVQSKESFPIQIIDDYTDIYYVISGKMKLTLSISQKLTIAEVISEAKEINIIQDSINDNELILNVPPVKDKKIDSIEINHNCSKNPILNCIYGSTISTSNNEFPTIKGSGEIKIIRPANINRIILEDDNSIETLYSFLKLKSNNLKLNISEVQVKNKQKLIGEKNTFCNKILIHPFSELSLQRMIVDSVEISFSSSLNILYNETVITHLKIFPYFYNFDKIPIKFYHPFPNLNKTDLELDISVTTELEKVVEFKEDFIAAKFIGENEDENQNACKSLNIIKNISYSYKCIKDEFGPNYNLVVLFSFQEKKIENKLIAGKIASYVIGGAIFLVAFVLAIYYIVISIKYKKCSKSNKEQKSDEEI